MNPEKMEVEPEEKAAQEKRGCHLEHLPEV